MGKHKPRRGKEDMDRYDLKDLSAIGMNLREIVS